MLVFDKILTALGLFLPLFVAGAHAQPLPQTNCANPRHDVYVHVQAQATCPSLIPYTAIVDQARQWSRAASPVRVVFFDQGLHTHYVHTDVITMSLDSRIKTMALWMHEYGHAICANEISQRWPDYAHDIQNSKRAFHEKLLVVEQVDKLGAEMRELEHRQVLNHDVFASKLGQMRDLMRKDFSGEDRVMSEMAARIRPTRSYEELCADVVTVLLSNDLSFMAESLSAQLRESSRFRHRDFALDNFGTTRATMPSPEEYENYGVMSSARTALGRKNIHTLINDGAKKTFFAKFMNLLTEEMKDYRAAKIASPEEAANRLVQKINERL